MKPKKAKPTRIRPYEGDMEIAQMISEKTGLEIIDVMSLALSAGLKAIRDNHYRVKLPLKLKIDESTEVEVSSPPAVQTAGGTMAFSSEGQSPTYKAKVRGK